MSFTPDDNKLCYGYDLSLFPSILPYYTEATTYFRKMFVDNTKDISTSRFPPIACEHSSFPCRSKMTIRYGTLKQNLGMSINMFSQEF